MRKFGGGAKNILRYGIAVVCICFCAAFAVGCGGETTKEVSWGRADAKEIDVNSKVAGRVVKLLVKEGDSVAAGDVIAYIDKRDLMAQKAQLEAAIEAARAQCAQAAVTTKMQRETTASALSEAQAAEEKARADLVLARADYERYASLLAGGAVSRQAFEQYETAYNVAKAACEQADAAEAALAKKLTEAEAALEQLEVSLDETEIRAPFNGIVTEKYIEEGSMISQGTPLVAVQDPLDNWVDMKVPETQLKNFSLNQKIELTARDGTTKVVGTVTDISKKAEFATQRATSERGDDTDIVSFNVKIRVNSALLRPGMRFCMAGENL